MAAICFYFQVHQPYRLRRYTAFEGLTAQPHLGRACEYFDTVANRRVCRKVADKCYRPANRLLRELVTATAGRFRATLSVTGTALDQFAVDCPDVLDSFAGLARTGGIEFLAETYHHSLASLASVEEFRAQIELHRRRLRDRLGVSPRVFRNTELIYDNGLARLAAEAGFVGVLAEGLDRFLHGRSPNHVYHPVGLPGVSVLLKNYGLSDDIAFRFGDQGWSGWPLTPEKFAAAVAGQPSGPLINLFMDYETLGEHQWATTGIFEFLRRLPGVLLAAGHEFVTASEAVTRFAPAGAVDVPHPTSWADSERDVSAWLGNALQNNALAALYELEQPIKFSGRADLLDDWRRLTTSDHLYYMSTKSLADGQVHAYFSPYPSPYDAYINFMNVLEHLRRRVKSLS